MGILTRKLIEELVEAEKLKIQPFHKERERLQPASYDLGVGRHFLLGPIPSETLGRYVDLERQPAKNVTIRIGQFAAVLTEEYLSLPCDICARFGVKSKFSRMGLIAFGGTQVDPGWSGHLAVSLLNIGPEEITLTLGEPAFTIEFHKLEVETEPYEGEYQDQRYFPPDQLNYILTARTGGLAEVSLLRERLDKIEREIEKAKEMQSEALERKSLDLLDELDFKNPETLAELHSKLSHRYLEKARESFSKQDLLQTSEKGWGAAAQAVKSCAAKREKRLPSHGDLSKWVGQLVSETQDQEIAKLWASANTLHRNFYENDQPSVLVGIYLEDINRFVQKVIEL